MPLKPKVRRGLIIAAQQKKDAEFKAAVTVAAEQLVATRQSPPPPLSSGVRRATEGVGRDVRAARAYLEEVEQCLRYGPQFPEVRVAREKLASALAALAAAEAVL